jgi:outer membrane autotransporter protein
VDLTVGSHTITLKVTNSGGLSGEDSVVINVVSATQSAGTLQFSSQTYNTSEGDSAATITVTRTGGSSGAASVNYSTSDGTASAGSDYTAASGTLNWVDGDSEPKSFAVPILSDSTTEGDETVNLSLSAPTGATLGSPSAATLNIGDVVATPTPGTLQFSSATYTAVETDSAATITVTRVGGSSGAASVNFSTSDGTASAGSDYTAASGTLNWVDGDSESKTFEVPILNDSVAEGDETVSLSLSGPTGATLGSPISAILTITDVPPATQNTLTSTATKIERISGSNQRLGLGQTSSPLKVRVSTGAGQGVAGVQLSWTLIPADGGSFTGGDSTITTTTDSNGESAVTLAVSRLGPLTITAAADAVGTVEFGINRFAGVAGLTENQRAIAGALDNACPALGSLQRALTAAEQDLLNTCDLLAQESNLGAALQQLAPQSVSAQGEVQLSLAKVRLRNILLRLDYLRGGATGPSLEGLSVVHGNATLPLASLKGMVGDERGGGASADEGALANRWGTFINGSVSFGDADTTNRDPGFEFDTAGITAGVDYRFNDNAILGGAFNYISSDSDFDNRGGKLDTDGYGLSLYGTYYQSERSFIDGVVSVGRNDYENRRNIRFSSIDQNADSDTMGWEYSLDVGTGYEFSRGAFTAVPQARVHYTHIDIDAYQERMTTSGSGLALDIADQSVESLRTALGTQLSYALSTSRGVYIPHLLLEWEHEFKDDSRLITARFLNDPTQSSFTLKTDSPDTNFFNLGAGLSATYRGGLSGFLYYETTLGQKNFTRNSILGGVRFEF